METPPLNDHITNKYWAGLFTDLSIEQTYMRDIKGNGAEVLPEVVEWRKARD